MRSSEMQRVLALCVVLLGAPAAPCVAVGALAADVESAPAPPPQAETKITYVTPTSVYIDAGSDDGLAVGDKAEVWRGGRVVAVLEVTGISSKKAVCGRLASDTQLEVGDIVRYVPSFSARIRQARPITPLAEPVSSSRSRRSALREFGLRGRIGVRFLAVRTTEGDSERKYRQPALELRLTGTNLGGSHVDLGVDVRARRTYRTLSNGDDQDEGLTRVYSAFGAWNPGGGAYRFSVGRQYSPSLAVVSIFDGVNAEYRRPGFAAGLFTGSQPDAADFGLSTEVREHGGYLELGSKAGATRRWAVTTGLIGSYDGGEINREFVYLQGRYDTPRVALYLVQEVDLNRGWRKDAEGDSLQFTSTFASVRYRFSEALALGAGWDNRRSVRLWRDFESPETEFDDRFRRGAWVTADGRFGRRLSAGVDLRRSEDTDGDAADAYTVRFGMRDLTPLRIGLRARGTRYDNPRLEGLLVSVSAGMQLAPWTHLEIHGGLRDESPREDMIPEGSWNWVGIDWDVSLGRRWLFLVSYEHTTGQQEGTDQLYTTISYRF